MEALTVVMVTKITVVVTLRVGGGGKGREWINLTWFPGCAGGMLVERGFVKGGVRVSGCIADDGKLLMLLLLVICCILDYFMSWCWWL